MHKLLVGITGISTKATRRCAEMIVEHLNLEHMNMRQPVINMIASIMGCEPLDLEYSVPGNQVIKSLKTSVHDLEITLGFSLRTLCKDYFINEIKAAQTRSRAGLNHSLFAGYLVTGITSEHEANWIREQGGIVVHIHHYESTTPICGLQEKAGDITISSHGNSVQDAIAAIRESLNIQEAA